MFPKPYNKPLKHSSVIYVKDFTCIIFAFIIIYPYCFKTSGFDLTIQNAGLIILGRTQRSALSLTQIFRQVKYIILLPENGVVP